MRAHTALPRPKPSCSDPERYHIGQKMFTLVSHKGLEATSGLSPLKPS